MDLKRFFGSREILEHYEEICPPQKRKSALFCAWVVRHSVCATLAQKKAAYREILETLEEEPLCDGPEGFGHSHELIRVILESEEALLFRFAEPEEGAVWKMESCFWDARIDSYVWRSGFEVYPSFLAAQKEYYTTDSCDAVGVRFTKEWIGDGTYSLSLYCLEDAKTAVCIEEFDPNHTPFSRAISFLEEYDGGLCLPFERGDILSVPPLPLLGEQTGVTFVCDDDSFGYYASRNGAIVRRKMPDYLLSAERVERDESGVLLALSKYLKGQIPIEELLRWYLHLSLVLQAERSVPLTDRMRRWMAEG